MGPGSELHFVTGSLSLSLSFCVGGVLLMEAPPRVTPLILSWVWSLAAAPTACSAVFPRYVEVRVKGMDLGEQVCRKVER